eukprot:CCRYP_011178-RA/>CCRYP_011178-RA protein AED:0.01 eAED:0.01 QI:235/1/1/1/1/1/2/3172/78
MHRLPSVLLEFVGRRSTVAPEYMSLGRSRKLQKLSFERFGGSMKRLLVCLNEPDKGQHVGASSSIDTCYSPPFLSPKI